MTGGAPGEAAIAPAGAGRRPVHHGSGPVGHERLDQRAGRGVQHDGHDDPGGHHPLLPRHGHVHAHRRQDRRHHRPPSRLRDRSRHLRLRVGPDRGLPDGRPAHPGLVDPGGHRRRPGAAGDGGPDRGQLRGEGTQGRLRRHRRRGGRRHRHRPHPGWLGHDRAVLAGGVRRRGRHRDRHPRRDEVRRRRGAHRTQAAAGRRRQHPVGGRPGRRRPGDPPVQHVGLDPAEGLARSSRSGSR